MIEQSSNNNLPVSFQMYHRQIFKLLLSNKVLDEPHQRRLFKTTDLVELFNLNEPTDGEFSESDRLFKESKLTLSGFSLSKIEQMKKLASILSKKISANVKSMRDKNENAGNSEEKPDEQNDDLRCIKAPATENDLLVDQSLSSGQNNTQKSPKYNNFNTNSDADIERNSNVENENTFKNNCEQDIIPVRSLNNNSVEKESKKFVLNDDKITLSSARKRKKHKKNSHSSKRNVSAIFEGERVSCLIGRRLGCSDEREESVSTTDDDYVLKKLFAKSSKSRYFIFKKIFYIYI